MDFYTKNDSRRKFLRVLSGGAASLLAFRLFPDEAAAYVENGDYAQELVKTPAQTEGPFFPDKMPLDTDNDLVIINGRTTPAAGIVTHLSGRVLDALGHPVRNAVIEIWQVDANGSYLHSGSDNRNKWDTNFQGYGRFLTDSTGAYYFRTIKPVAYPGRTPHIHVKVSKKSQELLTTQCYIKGDARNDNDGVLLGIRDTRARASVIVPFDPLKDSKVGELGAKFEIVLGMTPDT